MATAIKARSANQKTLEGLQQDLGEHALKQVTPGLAPMILSSLQKSPLASQSVRVRYERKNEEKYLRHRLLDYYRRSGQYRCYECLSEEPRSWG